MNFHILAFKSSIAIQVAAAFDESSNVHGIMKMEHSEKSGSFSYRTLEGNTIYNSAWQHYLSLDIGTLLLMVHAES